MTIQPLNHFVTDLYSPDHTSLEVLQENILSLERKSTLFNVLEKICYVALAAIIGVALAMSYQVIALSGVAAAALFLSAPIFLIAPGEFAKLSYQYARLAEAENRVSLNLHDIVHWPVGQITEFFRATGLDINRVNQEALRQVSPQEPLRALLPLMARYIAMRAEVDEIRKNRREHTANLEAEFARDEAAGRATPAFVKHNIRFANECTHSNNLELKAMPMALNAAALLEIIQDPTNVNLDAFASPRITKTAENRIIIDLPGLGQCEPKSYPERVFAKTHVPVGFGRLNGEIVPLTDENWLERHSRNITVVRDEAIRDTYFVFNDPARDPITHQQIEEANMDPARLRPMLYA